MEILKLKSLITELKYLMSTFNGILEGAEESVNLKTALQSLFYLKSIGQNNLCKKVNGTLGIVG